jgi:hypothetical protein
VMVGSVFSLGVATWPPSSMMQVKHHSVPITVTSAWVHTQGWLLQFVSAHRCTPHDMNRDIDIGMDDRRRVAGLGLGFGFAFGWVRGFTTAPQQSPLRETMRVEVSAFMQVDWRVFLEWPSHPCALLAYREGACMANASKEREHTFRATGAVN